LRIFFSRIISLITALWSAVYPEPRRAALLPLFRLPTPLCILQSSMSTRMALLSAALCLPIAPAFSQGIPFTNHLLERAESGHVQEQLEVARAFQLGLGVDRNLVEAARWFHKAADQGNPEAQCQLGFLYHIGTGVERDDREAFIWFQRAAVENYAPAQFDLSLFLLKGLGASP